MKVSSNRNRVVVEGFLAAARTAAAIDLEEIFHADLEVHEAESLPYGGVHEGIGAFNALVSRVFKCWGNTRVNVDAIIADGEHVVVLASMQGLGPRTQTPFSMPLAEIWRFREGKVAEIRPFYFDTKFMADLC